MLWVARVSENEIGEDVLSLIYLLLVCYSISLRVLLSPHSLSLARTFFYSHLHSFLQNLYFPGAFYYIFNKMMFRSLRSSLVAKATILFY